MSYGIPFVFPISLQKEKKEQQKISQGVIMFNDQST